jgi:hypothetical protein
MKLLSDDGCDRLVELFFLTLPAMDGDELVLLLHRVLAIAEREVWRAVREEQRRAFQRLTRQTQN